MLIYPLMFSPFKHRGLWVVINLNPAAHFLHFMAIFIYPSAPWLYMYGLAKHCTHRVFVYRQAQQQITYVHEHCSNLKMITAHFMRATSGEQVLGIL